MKTKIYSAMKKIFLLTMLLFQMTFVFGQENKWGPWNKSDCYPKIQFRAKLVSKQYYNGGSTSSDGCNSGQGYQWKVQVKNNYGKIVWVNFSGGNKSCVEKSVNDGNGLNLSPGEVGEISLKDWYSNSTTGIFVLIKAMAFLDSKDDDRYKNDPSLQYESCQNGGLCQICRVNRTANHCPDVKLSEKVKVNDAEKSNSKKNGNPFSSLNVEELENLIISNLNDYHKVGLSYVSIYRGNNQEITKFIVGRKSCDGDLYDPFSSHHASLHFCIKFFHYLYTLRYPIRFTDLKIEKYNSHYGVPLLYLNNEYKGNYIMISYNFGTNDENFIELQNLINALKNRDNNFEEPKKQDEDDIKETTIKNDKENPALNNLQKSLNETNPNYNEIKQNLLLYFEKENYPVLSQEQVFSDHGYHNYYFEPTKKFYMREFYVDKMIEVIFPEGFIEMGKEFGNLTKSEISEAATKNYHGKNYHIVSFNLKKN